MTQDTPSLRNRLRTRLRDATRSISRNVLAIEAEPSREGLGRIPITTDETSERTSENPGEERTSPIRTTPLFTKDANSTQTNHEQFEVELKEEQDLLVEITTEELNVNNCLLYTSPSPRD